MMKKRSLVIILSSVIVIGLIVLGVSFFVKSSETSKYPAYAEIKAEKLESGTVCENEQFELQWDQKNKRVILHDKEKGIQWCNTPEDELNNNPIESGVKTHPQVDSPIYVTYFDNINFAEKTAYAATGAIKNGCVSVQKIENGLSVIYSFEQEKFSVTVDYELRKDNLLVSVDTSKITESEENTVTEVAIAPFFCSVKNDTEDSYLFVPSGSGALVYPDVKLAKTTTTSEKVYGYDYSVDQEASFVKYESVKLPVYGAINSQKGICAIIEDGAEGANICTVSNNRKMNYAAVYASFLTRGYDLINTPKGFSSIAMKNKLYSEPVMNQVYSVAFYPFYGEDISYVNMADIYRNYLEEVYGFMEYETKAEENAINLNILGGAESTNFLFGIPYKEFFAATTLAEAEEVMKEVREVAGDINVSLKGYTSSGINVGKPAGGITIPKKLGSYKKLEEMTHAYEKTDTSLFLDYDTVRFRKSGSGITPLFGSAVTTNGKHTVLTVKSQATGLKDDDQEDYKLISRTVLDDLNAKVLKKALKKNVKGVGLSTLSSMSYADYKNEKYFVALGIEKQVSSIFNDYRKNGVTVMSNSANAYAAVYSDYIADVPTNSSDYDSFDVDVPFYEIVFKGYVPMSVSAVNLSSNPKVTVLKALETGSGLSFTMTANYDKELINSMEKDFYGMNREQVLERISTLVNKGVRDDLESLQDTTIVQHFIISDDVRCTVFENGKKVYVNYGDEAYSNGDLLIEAKNYLIEG